MSQEFGELKDSTCVRPGP